ncbi:hypothetical protein ISP17_10355 [Dyella ginsengisoli]|uniref:RiboL-PSP-HEPN domain-containing protein n=1 Tax=Dyella ginsengisoli TaxID=363848 RepID=A0ABW8JT87_9GAMM
MTSAALAAALAALQDVRTFLGISERRTDAVKEILETGAVVGAAATRWANDVVSFRNGRRFDYVCAVVLLYGILERFVEDAADEYLAALTNATPLYDNLPQKIRSTHFTKLTAHLQRTRDSRYDGRATAAQLATAFAGCLQGSVPYDLIIESMLHHTANFRPPVVDDFFGSLGVDSINRRVVETEVFADYLAATARAPTDRPEAVLDLVSELVSRRNEVAHGDISNTLAPSELLLYCDQLAAYCEALAEVLADALLAHLVDFYGVDHGNPIRVYNHNIVCIRSEGQVIRVGDSIAIQRPTGSWYAVDVVEIQINGTAVTTTPEGRPVDVGLKIDGRCKPTYIVRTGVLQRRQRAAVLPPLGSSDSKTVGETADAANVVDEVAIWTACRDEAYAWLVKHGGGGQHEWLLADYQRCCDALTDAEAKLKKAGRS